MARVKTIGYFAIMLFFYITLMIMLYLALNPETLFDWAYWILLAVPLFPISYIMLHFCLSLFFFKNRDYYLKKAEIRNDIRVAIILGIYNDFIEDAFLKTIESLRKTTKLKIDFYIVSDSTDEREIERELNFSKKHNAIYFHRSERIGQRPGAINSWADKYLDNYDYFMVLDKDSIFESEEMLENMVWSLQHPENNDIAVIQSSILNANHSTIYACAMGDIMRTFRVFSPKNDMFMLGRSLYWGHNGLIRKKAFYDAGGFSELHLCDDMVFTIKLDNKGWKVAYCTDIISYEYVPSDFVAFRERTNRWARANLGTIRYIIRNIFNTSFTTTFLVMLPVLFYVNILFLMGIIMGGIFIPKLSELGMLTIDQTYLFSFTAGLILYCYVLFLVFLARFFVMPEKESFRRMLKSST